MRWPNTSLDDDRAHRIDASRYEQITHGEAVDEDFADHLLLSSSARCHNCFVVRGLHYLLLPFYVHTYGFGQPRFHLPNESQKQSHPRF